MLLPNENAGFGAVVGPALAPPNPPKRPVPVAAGVVVVVDPKRPPPRGGADAAGGFDAPNSPPPSVLVGAAGVDPKSEGADVAGAAVAAEAEG